MQEPSEWGVLVFLLQVRTREIEARTQGHRDHMWQGSGLVWSSSVWSHSTVLTAQGWRWRRSNGDLSRAVRLRWVLQLPLRLPVWRVLGLTTGHCVCFLHKPLETCPLFLGTSTFRVLSQRTGKNILSWPLLMLRYGCCVLRLLRARGSVLSLKRCPWVAPHVGEGEARGSPFAQMVWLSLPCLWARGPVTTPSFRRPGCWPRVRSCGNEDHVWEGPPPSPEFPHLPTFLLRPRSGSLCPFCHSDLCNVPWVHCVPSPVTGIGWTTWRLASDLHAPAVHPDTLKTWARL